LAATSVRADVIPPPPPYIEDVSLGLQKEVIRRLGPGMNMRLHNSIGGIAVSGDYAGSRRNASFHLLLRDQRGWTSRRTGSSRPVPPSIGAEIDRILQGDIFWREDGFDYGYPCRGIGRVMQVVHRGRSKLSRQPCGPKGLAGRLADLVSTERIPAGPPPPVGGRSEIIRAARGVDYENKLPPPADPDAAQLLLFLTVQSVYALRDGDIERHVEAYADDVTMVWPGGTEKGKDLLRRRASAQIWNGLERRHLQPATAYVRQTGPDGFVLSGTYKYWDGNLEFDMPVTTQWQKRRGIWEIRQQQLGAAVPANAAASAASQPRQ
jgi:ketosteroid isomerase-like protein